MTDDIRKIYKEIGVNCRGTLIFGDTVRRPWSLNFDRDFLIERAGNINEFTVDTVKKCIQLIEPALNKSESNYIEKLISIYMNQLVAKANATKAKQVNGNDQIHTLSDITLQLAHEHSVEQTSSKSIWREAPENLNWKSCPIGSFP